LLEDCRRGHEHIYTRVFITTKINFRSWRGVLDATLCDIAYQGLAAGQWFFPASPVSFTNKTDTNKTEILLKIALNTINTTKIYGKQCPITTIRVTVTV